MRRGNTNKLSTIALSTALVCASLQACATSPTAQEPPKRLPTTAGAEGARPTPSGDLERASSALTGAVNKAKASSDARALIPAVAAATAGINASLVATDARIGSVWRGTQELPNHEEVLTAWRSPEGALSAGTTSRGHLLGSKELAFDGPHHHIIARARPRNTRFGHPTIITALQDAGEAVAREFPNSRVAIGNIAYANGGDIRWSVSHNSGRDADIAFYVIDAVTGEALDEAPDLVAFGDDGNSLGKEQLIFDVERNWALAKALMRHPRAQIQYLFISEGLKAKLIEHAKQRGEPEDLIEQALGVLRQPTDSSPHNDHFHLRLTCDLADRVRGCVDRGPQWPWVDWHEDELLTYTLAMKPALESPDKQTRLDALDYIAAIQSPYGAEFALLHGATNDDPEVRAHAISVASKFYGVSGAALGAMPHVITDAALKPDERVGVYAMLRRSRDEEVIPFLQGRLLDAGVAVDEKQAAARALSHHMLPELVPFLLDQLELQQPAVRVELAQVLRRITIHTQGFDWSSTDDAQVEVALAGWRTWWEEHSALPRELWIERGLEVAGIPKQVQGTPASIEPMLTALASSQDHITYNINRSLREITGRWAPLEQSDGKKVRAYWSPWWKKHRRKWLDRA